MAEIYAREPSAFETAEKNPVNFAILTTKANEAVSHIHERMPVILPLGREKRMAPTQSDRRVLLPALPRRTPDQLPRHAKDEPRLVQRPRSHPTT
jgi:putative SOS response-associated peptidase YedK